MYFPKYTIHLTGVNSFRYISSFSFKSIHITRIFFLLGILKNLIKRLQNCWFLYREGPGYTYNYQKSIFSKNLENIRVFTSGKIDITSRENSMLSPAFVPERSNRISISIHLSVSTSGAKTLCHSQTYSLPYFPSFPLHHL